VLWAISPLQDLDKSQFSSYNIHMVRHKLIRLIQQAMINVERTVTLPDERYRALKMAESMLMDLMDPAKTPRVPRSVRAQARSVLRHYPGSYYLEQLARRSPDIITPHMEDLTRFIRSGEPDPEVTQPQERDPSL
jgi:hypothetical protein